MDEGPYITDADWLSIVEYADHAFSRSYLRVHILPVATADSTHITVEFLHDVAPSADDNAMASASAGYSRIRFYIVNWPHMMVPDMHTERLINMGNTLAHEIVHILEPQCDHDPVDTRWLLAVGMDWRDAITTDIYFSDATRACFIP